MSATLKSTGVGHFVSKFGEKEIDPCTPNFNTTWEWKRDGLSYVKEIMAISSAVWAQCTNVTDRQTDHGTVTSIAINEIACPWCDDVVSEIIYRIEIWQASYIVVLRCSCLNVWTGRVLRESVVWLCANNRVAEAEEIIRNAAKLNNITMPDKILARSSAAGIVVGKDGDKAGVDDGEMEDGELLDKRDSLSSLWKRKKTEPSDARYSIIDIFRNRHLTINTLCMMFLWSAICYISVILLRATAYAIARICYRPSVRLSVCLSVRWVYHTKTVEVIIMKFSPYGSPISLVFAG